MNPRRTGVLALVTIALGGFIYFYEIEGESGRQATLDEEKRIFPGLEADTVDVIEFSTLDGIEARFVRVDGRWRLSDPVDALADTTALDAIADALASLAREGSISNAALAQQDGPSPKDAPRSGLEQYGLGPQARAIHFEVAGSSYGLRVGRSTPVGGHLYVAGWAMEERGEDLVGQVSGAEISYIEGFRINSLNRNLDDLRERRILHFEGAELRTLRITWPDESAGFIADVTDEQQSWVEVALARDSGRQWHMGAPMRAEADQEILRDLISNLSYLRAASFVDERTDDVAVALADPAISFHWTRSGDHVERRMRIGGPFEGGLLVEGPNGKLFTIAPGRLEEFKRRVVDYRYKSLADFDLVEARHLLIEFEPEGEGEGKGKVEATLGEVGWMGSAPAIDPDRASDLIRTLSSLRATDILAEEMGPAELTGLGLFPPHVRIRVGTESGVSDDSRVLADVRIGRLISGRGLLAQRAGDPTVFVLAESVVQELPISVEAFASRFEKQVADPGSDVPAQDLEDLEVDPLEGVEIP